MDVLPSRYLAALPVAIAVMLLSVSLMGAYNDDSLTRPTPLRTALRSTAPRLRGSCTPSSNTSKVSSLTVASMDFKVTSSAWRARTATP